MAVGFILITTEPGCEIGVREEVSKIKCVKGQWIVFGNHDLFVKVAAHIHRSGPLNVVGNEINKIKEITNLRPVVNKEQSQIIGSVIYIDNYGNVVTNITEKLFKEISKTREFTINARSVKFSKIHKNYSDAIDFTLEKKDREEDGKKIALFNNLGYLQLSIYKSNPQTVGSASSLFGLNYRDVVSVYF